MIRRLQGDPEMGGFRPHTSETLKEHFRKSKLPEPTPEQVEAERRRVANNKAGRDEKARFVCTAAGCVLYSGGQRWWILDEKATTHELRTGHTVVRI